ncbi:M43 family zinc metalloprotease [Desulfococcaceae bacterium HSG9]|nr:M43 family zinc metalloprotease [Desulfococcaceae bacterium HSG9]
MLNKVFSWAKISIIILTILIIGVSYTYAKRTCATMDVLAQQLASNPKLADKMQEIETFTQQRILTGRALQGIITLPVHVIVVYSTALQNISDAQIESQITVLNQDYSKTNTDWTNTPAEFIDLVADYKIQFTLQGIERYFDSTSELGLYDSVKSAYPAYQPSTHLNMWVCNIGGDYLGYAQFPGGDLSTDGVVFSPQYCGSSDYDDGTFYLDAPFDKGRTATHEVGHWLNLHHIWGDGACGVSDHVDDTPDAEDSNGGCPTHPHNTCSSNDMFMFTEGQKTRSGVIFESGGPRASWYNATGCVGTDACDGAITYTLLTDNFASETSWDLKNSSGTVIQSGSGYTNNTTYTFNWNLAEGQYTFTIYDSYEDGICCAQGNGSYSLVDGCGTTLKSGGDFGSSEIIRV